MILGQENILLIKRPNSINEYAEFAFEENNVYHNKTKDHIHCHLHDHNGGIVYHWCGVLTSEMIPITVVEFYHER